MHLKNIIFCICAALVSNAIAVEDYKEDFLQFEAVLSDVHRESITSTEDSDWSDLDLDDWDFDDAVAKYPFAAVKQRIPENYFVKEIDKKTQEINSDDLEISVNTIFATNIDTPDVRLKPNNDHQTGLVKHISVGILLPDSYSPDFTE